MILSVNMNDTHKPRKVQPVTKGGILQNVAKRSISNVLSLLDNLIVQMVDYTFV